MLVLGYAAGLVHVVHRCYRTVAHVHGRGGVSQAYYSIACTALSAQEMLHFFFGGWQVGHRCFVVAATHVDWRKSRKNDQTTFPQAWLQYPDKHVANFPIIMAPFRQAWRQRSNMHDNHIAVSITERGGVRSAMFPSFPARTHST